MNPRKLIGAVALGLLLLFGLGLRYIAGMPRDDWDTLWKLAYLVGLCVAFFMAFYDRKNFPEKVWDFNPKRGAIYFLLGWVIFPFTMAIDAMFGSQFTLSEIAFGTLFASILIGIAGTFTENVGV